MPLHVTRDFSLLLFFSGDGLSVELTLLFSGFIQLITENRLDLRNVNVLSRKPILEEFFLLLRVIDRRLTKALLS